MAVPGMGSITSHADQLDQFLQNKVLGQGINFMTHSMGRLDCLHLITLLSPWITHRCLLQRLRDCIVEDRLWIGGTRLNFLFINARKASFWTP
ncbi:hypothetical protein BJV77DRAFT_1029016 [Russula vinacea]|nr:hypothetical protein BJV77DRAFT_1029016 [Russula vinacea]